MSVGDDEVSGYDHEPAARGVEFDLDAIEARLAATTPGAWMVDPTSGDVHHGTEFVAATNGGSNAFFISNARSDVPNLITEVRRLRLALTEAQSR